MMFAGPSVVLAGCAQASIVIGPLKFNSPGLLPMLKSIATLEPSKNTAFVINAVGPSAGVTLKSVPLLPLPDKSGEIEVPSVPGFKA